MTALREALLEIGSEELPASFIVPALRQLRALAEMTLQENQIPFDTIEVYGTPRRLAVLISGLPERSQDQQKTVTGPPAAMAKDPQGQWTAAALGFARKQGLKPSDLGIEKDRLSATIHIKGTTTRHVLAVLFPQWISKLEFPKSMTWEPTHFRYPRPIRWLTAVFGSELVSFALAGVRSTRWTFGLPLHSSKKIAIAPAKYVTQLKNQCVLVDPAARQEAIRRLAEQAVKRAHGHVMLNTALLEQVANLVEHPVAILGNFDPSYLDLPPEVLVTCLEHHQKFFPVSASATGGKLLPHFIGIRNGMSVHQETVREGYERVLTARLSDAKFFFTQDRKQPLSMHQKALHGIMFQQKLGSLADKTERIHHTAAWLASQLPEGARWQAQAVRAALLCKADLATAMVGEFPELQGVVARIYAEADQEEPAVAHALEEHYWPMTLQGKLPMSDVGAAVAIADKADTLAGDFVVGLIPTGSADPYGLRRAAVGILRVLEERGWPVPVEVLMQEALAKYPHDIVVARPSTARDLNQFMQQRFGALLQERGFRSDETDAVLSVGVGSVSLTIARLQALHDLRKEKEFEPLAVAFKRGMNIVRQATKSGVEGLDQAVQPALFKEPSETALHEALERATAEAHRHLEARAYREALRAMIPLREPLDAFFAGVMVMAEDLALRTNRLALVSRLVKTFTQLADFSKLQGS